MSVIATKIKNVVMVRFPAPEKLENRHVEFDVVCYVRLDPTGTLEINYSHHVVRSRDASVGMFGENKSRMPLDATLHALVTIGVMQEFWSCVATTIRVLPADMATPLTEVEF